MECAVAVVVEDRVVDYHSVDVVAVVRGPDFVLEVFAVEVVEGEVEAAFFPPSANQLIDSKIFHLKKKEAKMKGAISVLTFPYKSSPSTQHTSSPPDPGSPETRASEAVDQASVNHP